MEYGFRCDSTFSERRTEESVGAEYRFRPGGCVCSLRRTGVSGATRSSVLQLCDENNTQQHTHGKVSTSTFHPHQSSISTCLWIGSGNLVVLPILNIVTVFSTCDTTSQFT